MLFADVFGRTLMDDFFDSFTTAAFTRSGRIGTLPAMKADVQDFDGRYQIDLELPGFKKEDLHAE